MKFAKKGILTLLFSLIFFAGVSFAETVYVRGVMKITMRTGPGTHHKIIDMVSTGDSLEIVENGRDWTRVRNPEGKEGWVLTRFITREVPMKHQVVALEEKNKELTALLEKIRAENQDFEATRKKLAVIEDAYNRLKKKSADFLALEAAHKKMTQAFNRQKDRINTLESRLGKEDIKWFLSGAGILLVGIILGVSTRRKKQRSLL